MMPRFGFAVPNFFSTILNTSRHCIIQTFLWYNYWAGTLCRPVYFSYYEVCFVPKAVNIHNTIPRFYSAYKLQSLLIIGTLGIDPVQLLLFICLFVNSACVKYIIRTVESVIGVLYSVSRTRQNNDQWARCDAHNCHYVMYMTKC